MTRNGTPDAFTALYERHWRDLVAYCRPRLDRVDDAEDAAHEALLRAYRALPDVRAEDPLWPWLATIAANVCFDMRRRDRRRSTMDASSAVAAGLAPPQPADVHDDARHRLRADLLHRALRRLPPAARRLLLLREYAGWTYEEIARTEGTSVASVRSRLMRHRRRLGHRVEELARVERQWPLPVGWLRQRARLVRDWAERLAHTVAGLDAAVLFGGLGTGVQAAAILVVAAVVGGRSPGVATEARVVPASAVGAESVATPLASAARGRRAPIDPEATMSSATVPPVSTRTLRIDPPRPTFHDYAAPTEESTTTVEDHEDWFYVAVNAPLVPTNGSHEFWISCAKSEIRRIACPIARQAWEATPE